MESGLGFLIPVKYGFFKIKKATKLSVQEDGVSMLLQVGKSTIANVYIYIFFKVVGERFDAVIVTIIIVKFDYLSF